MTSYPPPPAYNAPPPGGYSATTPSLGGVSPPPPPPGYQPGQILVISSGETGTHCPYCNTKSQNIPRRACGGVVIAWTVSLILVGMLLCSWIPCVVDGCYDI